MNEKEAALFNNTKEILSQQITDPAGKLALAQMCELVLALDQQAIFDAATGLPGRRAYEDMLDGRYVLSPGVKNGKYVELNRGEQADRPVIGQGILMVDLNNFKEINDKHGHPEGDRILKYAAVGLRACIRSTDTVARIGGDEFAAILQVTGQSNKLFEDGRVLADMMHDRFAGEVEEMKNGKHRELLRALKIEQVTEVDMEALHTLGASFGFVARPNAEVNLRQMNIEADVLMYQNKVERKARQAAETTQNNQL
jgi:diguanylate cyclase (GGDEF)-like protein